MGLTTVHYCPHCKGPTRSWTWAELLQGWRWEAGGKVYHCREAAVND